MTDTAVNRAVLAANAAFYKAFADRDLPAMEALWARGAAVACVHPGWPALFGRERVLESWRVILGNAAAPRITCREPVVHVLENTAFVVCLEVIGDGHLAATNIFVHEGGSWLMVHHQAGPTAPTAAGDSPSRGDTVH